ncbi:MAG: hypothetical protein V2A75_08120 [Pseudomonadota bacterium]
MTEQELYIRKKKSKFEEEKNTDSYKRVQRMAKTLSIDLYESESHFIYELIQNAQDNDYNPNVFPEISFYLLDDGILIQNNEVGFNQNNINSICDFHESTKTENKELGYIGEKGIGFKSVFTISDTPAIHSNGYRFYFKKGEYIEPYWIDDFKSYPEKFADENYTSIYLPYSHDFKHIDDIKNKIKDIEPFVLLFLDKLKKICIYNQNELVLDVSKKINKNGSSNELILKTTKAKYDFITINKIISRPENLIEQKREKIKHREIIFAFPLNEIKDDRIFAFLPTHVKSGLPFIIQADFILTANREGISFTEDWNNWLVVELQQFYEEAVTVFQNHDLLKFTYLIYYKKSNNGNNPVFSNLYEKTIKSIKNKEIILNDNGKWEKPENILILDGIDFEINLLKKLYGTNFSVIHPDFKIDKDLIVKFNIEKINKDKLIDRICRYLENKKNIEVGELKAFTSFLADYETDHLIRRVKKILPILPLYMQETKDYYDANDIYLSDIYQSSFSTESMIKDINIDFTTWNFLSDYYLSNEKLKIFIVKILGDSNQKIINFFETHTDILEAYLYADIENNYPKVLDFLIETKIEDQIIKKLPLILTNQNKFKSAFKATDIYFSHSGTESLEVLNSNLFNILNQNQRYKDLFVRVYGIKTADDVTIIMDQDLRWFEQNKNSRNSENDLHILKLTKKIIYHLDNFDESQKKQLKNKILFIATNSSDNYIKSEKIYLSQNLQEAIYGTDSIEKFIVTDRKELFDFLDARYEIIFEEIDEAKIIRFMHLISFSKSLRKENTESFIKSLKPDLLKDENLKAIKLIIENNPNSDFLKTLKVYDHLDRLDEVQNLYFSKIGDTNIAHLSDEYKKMNLEWGNFKQYFKESGKKAKDIQYIISYLQSESIDCIEAEKVFRYIDTEDLSNQQSLQKFFKTHKLIFDAENNRKYLDDARWKRDKSGKTILSEIYTHDLERFFVKKLGLSDDITIQSVIDELKAFDRKSFEYYELLIKLGELAVEEIQIQKYYNENGLNKYLADDNPKSIKSFIVSKLRLFLLDNGKSNEDENFYFNDLNLDNYESKLLSKIFSALEDAPPPKHFEPLFSHLHIKKLSDLPVKSHCGKFICEFELSKYQQYLRFAYDYLYSEEKINYDAIITNIDQFQSINMIKTVSIYDKLYTSRTISQLAITDASIDFFIEVDILNVTSEEGIYKFIGQKLGIEYEKIELYAQKGERYRKDKNIKSDQHFSIEFAELPQKPQDSIMKEQNHKEDHNYDESEKIPTLEAMTYEREERKKSGYDIAKGYERDVPDDGNNSTNPSIVKDQEKYLQAYEKKRTARLSEITNASKSISDTTIEKLKLQNTNFPNNSNKVKPNKYGYEETKNTFKRRDWYLGQCQICGFTFKTKDGNHCERFTWTDFGRGEWTEGQKALLIYNIIEPGNSLCLCSRCYSILKHGGQFKALFLDNDFRHKYKSNEYSFENFLEDIELDKPLTQPDCFNDHVEWKDMYFTSIELNKKEENIYFTEEHLLLFFIFLTS